MPRLKLIEQPYYKFQHTLTVRVTDLNYGAHLGNDTIVSFLHQARAMMFHELGFTELNLGDEATGIVVADLAVNFLAEGFLHDEITLNAQVGELTRKGLRVFYRLRKGGTLLALAETGIVAFDYRTRQATAWPAPFLAALAQYQGLPVR